MEPPTHVTVYHFRLFGIAREGPRVSPHKATRRTIVHVLRGEVLEDTAEEVEASLVDNEGVCRRLGAGSTALNA